MTRDELKTALANLQALPPPDRYPILAAVPEGDEELRQARAEALAQWMPAREQLTAQTLHTETQA